MGPQSFPYTRDKEHRRKMSVAVKNSKHSKVMRSEIEREKRRVASLNNGNMPPITKGKDHPMFGKRGELSPLFKGFKFCSDCGKKLARRTAKKCNRCNKLKPTTLLNKQIRNIFEYRQWRDDVFHRDKFTCQSCGIVGGKLNAHHITPYLSILKKYQISNLKEAIECSELWNINNGITLCIKCHKKAHKIRRA